MRGATTFGTSQIAKGAKEYEKGVRLGTFLAQRGFVVKGRGYGGLMEVVSLGVRKAQGECIGIALQAFESRRFANVNLNQKIVAKAYTSGWSS